MGDGVRIGRSDSFIFSALALGLMSASFYLSIVLSFAFLIPLQLAFGRLGKRGGNSAALLSGGIVAVVQAWRLFSGGGSSMFLATLAGVAYPFLLILAILVLNASIWNKTAAVIKALVVSLVLAILMVPVVSLLVNDGLIRASLTESIQKLLTSFAGTTKSSPSMSSEGYDAAALLASLDPAEMVATTMKMFSSSFAALLFLLVGGSWWAGNRMAGEGSSGRRETPSLMELHLPVALVWPFLVSWALLLGILYLKPSPVLEALAWNLSLIFTLAYTAQGTGIVAHYLARWKVPRFIRIVMAVSLLIGLTSSPLGTVLVAIFPLLGVTELWIPYRNPKGVGA